MGWKKKKKKMFIYAGCCERERKMSKAREKRGRYKVWLRAVRKRSG